MIAMRFSETVPSASSRKPQPLGQTLSKQLLAYATMAGAGVAGCASHAEAEVVYTPVTSFVHYSYPLDLNNDGIVDFHFYSFSLSSFLLFLSVIPALGNKVLRTNRSCAPFSYGAAPLPEGAVVGPTQPLHPFAHCMAYLSTGGRHGGPWFGAKERYLGLAFVVDGKTHFGWARVSIDESYYLSRFGRLQGYAYETEPGKPIVAGDEGGATASSVQRDSRTLGALALGTAGSQ
jgi:hypothetical protein